MAEFESATPDYTMGFSDEFIATLKRYTAVSHAKHLLPYLRPGMRILDFGCGPGTISAGLAARVDPGHLHGVDMEASQVELARTSCKLLSVPNVTFHVADVTDMPFEDDFFEVAHCHALLQHVPDTQAVLAEVKRVMKPGGIISCREMICESSFSHPDFGVMRNAWAMFEDLLAADDGHPQMGKELKEHLLTAGFQNIQASGSFDNYHSAGDVEFIYGVATQWFLSPEIVEAAIQYGASTRELADQVQEAYDKWREHPGAFCGVAYGEAIANKP